MKWNERAIELPRLILLASIGLGLIGLVAMFTLPKERSPRVKLPVIVVAVPNPGAAPPTNEAEIVRPVEEEVGTLSGLREDGGVLSQAVNGAAVFQFVFDNDVEVVEAKRDVESLFNRVKGEFPEQAQTDPGPLINDIAFESFPIIQVVIAGGDGGDQRRHVADALEQELQSVAGVAGIDIFGGLKREVHLEVNPHRMALYGFDYPAVAEAIRRANLEAPTGSVESLERGLDQRIRLVSRLGSLEEIRAAPIGVVDGQTIRLSDIAQVRMSHAPRNSLARYRGQDAVVLMVRAKTDIDVMGAAETVQQRVERFIASGRHENTQIGTVRSQAREIGYMMNQLLTSAGYGTILVVAMLWLALGWRNAALISVAIPLAILTTTALMWLAKKTFAEDIAINNMTLFAMILVIGMVVDGCIIVGENIFRRRELGDAPLAAAKRGIAEVAASLICAYLTSFAAFAPMYLVRGIMGDFLSLLPTVVMFALFAAFLVDHFLLPMLSVYIMRAEPRGQDGPENSAADVSPEQREIRDAERFAQSSRVMRAYARGLGYCLHHRLLVLFLALATASTPVGLFSIGAVGFEFFPQSDVPVIEVLFEAPLGSSMQGKTAPIAGRLEKAVERAVHPHEWHQPSDLAMPIGPVTTIGEPGALNTNLADDSGSGPEFGMIYIELKLAEDRQRSASQIRRAIAQTLPEIPGVQTRVRSPSEGPPAGSPVAVRIYGLSDTPLETLARRAVEVQSVLRKIPGVYDISSSYRDRPEIVAKPERELARLFNLDTAGIARSINFALEGVRISEVDFGGDEEIDLRLRNRPEFRNQIDDLRDLPLRAEDGRIVSLDQVADLHHVRNPNPIAHRNLRRVVVVTAELREGVLADTVKSELVEAFRPELTEAERSRLVRNRTDPTIFRSASTFIDFGGENEIRDDALEDLKVALIVAALAMMIILTVKFNSFVQPLIILFSVPLSLVGIAIGHMVCGFYFSIASVIGIVALSGIVVNDAIVMVDFVNRIRGAGVSMERAVTYAGQLRLRPIFLTTVTTLGGLLPLSLNLAGGGEFWQPLTITIMFGLGFATILQLLIIPLACYTFDRSERQSWLDPAHHPRFTSTPPGKNER